LKFKPPIFIDLRRGHRGERDSLLPGLPNGIHIYLSRRGDSNSDTYSVNVIGSTESVEVGENYLSEREVKDVPSLALGYRIDAQPASSKSLLNFE
jgi:hypothetical protein